ncbi:MAG: NTP transferase domain-containing protein [Candidatus Eisenbacteria bacterium]
MKAVILNSGTGSRMGDLTRSRPKCLVDLSTGETILSRQIGQIRSCGITDFIITTGPFEHMIEEYVNATFPGVTVSYIHNPDYRETNYIVSMHLAGGLLRDEILLLHGDIVTTEDMVRDVIEFAEPNAAVIDSTAGLPADDFKARLVDGLITEIGVDVAGSHCVALLPVYSLSRDFMNVWMDEIALLVEAGELGVYAEEAFNRRSADLPLSPVDCARRLCMEVDTPEDLEKAMKSIGL